MSKSEHRWRDFKKVHPTAAVFNKGTTDDDLRKLAADINANGLKARIREREVAGEPGTRYIIDGISRLDAMEKVLGWQLVDEKGNWIGAVSGQVELRFGRTHEQIRGEVISLNARRRHQTKEDLAEAIAETKKIEYATRGKEFLISGDEKPHSPKGGRPRDEFKKEVIEEAAKFGISKPAAERGLARLPDRPKIKTKKPKHKPPEPKKEETFDQKLWRRWLAWLKNLKPHEVRVAKELVHKWTTPGWKENCAVKPIA